MVLMKKEKLKKLLTKVFLKFKLSKAHAKICSDALVNAELVGATGHGVSRLKMYCDRISKKLINPKPKFKYFVPTLLSDPIAPNTVSISASNPDNERTSPSIFA